MLDSAVPHTKPATERIAGLLSQKMSPQLPHAVVQRRIATTLGAWADETTSGQVGPEWDFRLCQATGEIDAFTPDVAFLSFARAGDDGIRDIPIVAPDVAVEIRSPKESRARRELKIKRYLAAGTLIVLDVDPQRKTMRVHRAGQPPRLMKQSDVFKDESLPGFALDLGTIFATIRRR